MTRSGSNERVISKRVESYAGGDLNQYLEVDPLLPCFTCPPSTLGFQLHFPVQPKPQSFTVSACPAPQLASLKIFDSCDIGMCLALFHRLSSVRLIATVLLL